jgi:hypothetical protein
MPCELELFQSWANRSIPVTEVILSLLQSTLGGLIPNLLAVDYAYLSSLKNQAEYIILSGAILDFLNTLHLLMPNIDSFMLAGMKKLQVDYFTSIQQYRLRK